jgi:hypothetical protein
MIVAFRVFFFFLFYSFFASLFPLLGRSGFGDRRRDRGFALLPLVPQALVTFPLLDVHALVMVSGENDEPVPRDKVRHDPSETISRVGDYLVIVPPFVIVIRRQARGLHATVTGPTLATVVPLQVLPLGLVDQVRGIDAVLAMTTMADLHLHGPAMRVATTLTARRLAQEEVRRDLVPFRSALATIAEVVVWQDAPGACDHEAHLLHLLEPRDVLALVGHVARLLETEQESPAVKHHLPDVWDGISLDFRLEDHGSVARGRQVEL